MPQVISFVGNSDSGKTTIIEKLISRLVKEGYKIGTVKHAHKGFNLDRKGKDSFRHMKAGAEVTIIADPEKIHVTKKIKKDNFSNLKQYFADMDLIIVEGYKKESISKIAIIKNKITDKALYVNDPYIVALISDAHIKHNLPVFQRRDIEDLAIFIKNRFL
jgi:molybdopterin-guanine dinucleotide biosynthesis protein B